MAIPNYRESKVLIQLQFDPFSLQPVDIEWLENKYNPEEPAVEIQYKRPNVSQRRRLREEQAEGQYTKEEWFGLRVKYNHCCLRCGPTDKQIVADHIRPLYRGGNNGIENIQPLCWECNLWKGLKIIDYRPDSPDFNLSPVQ
jgi:5-methylcytosine-specific restriction endonuclease McrA